MRFAGIDRAARGLGLSLLLLAGLTVAPGPAHAGDDDPGLAARAHRIRELTRAHYGEGLGLLVRATCCDRDLAYLDESIVKLEQAETLAALARKKAHLTGSEKDYEEANQAWQNALAHYGSVKSASGSVWSSRRAQLEWLGIGVGSVLVLAAAVLLWRRRRARALLAPAVAQTPGPGRRVAVKVLKVAGAVAGGLVLVAAGGLFLLTSHLRAGREAHKQRLAAVIAAPAPESQPAPAPAAAPEAAAVTAAAAAPLAAATPVAAAAPVGPAAELVPVAARRPARVRGSDPRRDRARRAMQRARNLSATSAR